MLQTAVYHFLPGLAWPNGGQVTEATTVPSVEPNSKESTQLSFSSKKELLIGDNVLVWEETKVKTRNNLLESFRIISCSPG